MKDNDLPLKGRVAIVIGASRGIGAATARALGDAGANVVLAARGAAALDALADDLTLAGRSTLAVPTDITDAAAVRRLVDRTVKEFGRVDIAVNSAAGAGPPPTPLADISVGDYDAAVEVTQRGVFLAMKYEIPAILEAGGGSIVNVASTAGLEAVGGLAAYVSAKYAVVGLTRTAALDYAARGVRVNALAPGPTLTEQLVQAGPQARARVAEALPMKRLGRPEEVAAAAVWLCSDAAGFITGAILPLDGGMLAGMAPFQPSASSAPAGAS
jgi:NAD(P)-dependent dehydrogenase (short-subunit alcohol dehydrogenase family)